MSISGYRRTKDLPAEIAVFPLDGALLLPGAVLPLQIFEPRYLNMIDDVMAGDRLIGMIQTLGEGPRTRPALVRVGCAGRITSYSETSDGKYLIALTGLCRFKVITELDVAKPYRRVAADFALFETDLQEPDAAEPADRGAFVDLLRVYLDRRGLGVDWDTVNAAPSPALINSLCMALPFAPQEKQVLLEAPDLGSRRTTLATLLAIDSAWPTDEDDAPRPIQ